MVKIRRVLGLVCCAAALASCATIPTGSSPQALGSVRRAPGVGGVLAVPAPSPGMSPETLIRDFLKAAADSSARHGAARQFLTEEAAHTWDDSPGATVVDKIDVLSVEQQDDRQPDRMRFQIRAVALGHIESNGVVGRDNATVDRQVEVTRVHGEWRISGLDKGALVDAQQFQYRYQRRLLYFLNPSGTELVPDPRWVVGDSATLADQLIRELITGPRPLLAQSVRTQLPSNTALRGSITRVDGLPGNPGARGVYVDFQGLGELDQKGKQLLAAQVIWTLASAGVTGPYLISSNGAPLDDHFPEGWAASDVALWDPSPGAAGNALYAVYGGTLVRVTDRGVQKAAGALGVVNSIRSAAVSGQGKLAAAVVSGPDGSAQLMVGQPDKTVNIGATAERTMTRPTWMPDESRVWTVLDGETVISVSVDVNGQLMRSDVDIAELHRTPEAGPITELRLSHDGVRAALVVGGKLIMMNVRQVSGGGYVLTDAQSLLTSNPTKPIEVTSVDWGPGDVLYAAQALADAPVLEVPVGSPFSTVITSRNLTPPVSFITASTTTIYVTDSRGVLQLRRGVSGETDDLWREMPMLSGTYSNIVLPK